MVHNEVGTIIIMIIKYKQIRRELTKLDAASKIRLAAEAVKQIKGRSSVEVISHSHPVSTGWPATVRRQPTVSTVSLASPPRKPFYERAVKKKLLRGRPPFRDHSYS